MLDRERILARLDDLEQYVGELRQVMPADFDHYRAVATRRACERLAQISIEAVLDVCAMLVAGLRLGLPAEEDDLLEKLQGAGILSPDLRDRLRRMRGFRNILVHEYARVDDHRVFENLQAGLRDFEEFRTQILQALRSVRGDR